MFGMKRTGHPHPIKDWLKDEPGRTRVKLASVASISPARMTQILDGEMPSFRVAAALSQETGISMEEIFAAVRQGEAA